MAKKEEESKSTYIVLPNNEVRTGGKRDPISRQITEEATIHKAGDEIELTKTEYESMKHAVGTPAEYKRAEIVAEAKKILEDDSRQKALAEAAANEQATKAKEQKK